MRNNLSLPVQPIYECPAVHYFISTLEAQIHGYRVIEHNQIEYRNAQIAIQRLNMERKRDKEREREKGSERREKEKR